MTAPVPDPPPRTAGARFFAWLYTPAAARAGTTAVLAIEHEVMTGVDASLDHTVAHARLAWWQEELERLAAAIPAHPASLAARDAFLAGGLAAPDLRALTALAARRLARDALARGIGPDDLATDATLWTQGLFRPLVLLAMGGPVTKDAQAGPAIEVLGHALLAQELAPSDERRAALRDALEALPAAWLPRLRGLVVWATLALRTASLGAFAENWLAWRTARRAERGHFRR